MKSVDLFQRTELFWHLPLSPFEAKRVPQVNDRLYVYPDKYLSNRRVTNLEVGEVYSVFPTTEVARAHLSNSSITLFYDESPLLRENGWSSLAEDSPEWDFNGSPCPAQPEELLSISVLRCSSVIHENSVRNRSHSVYEIKVEELICAADLPNFADRIVGPVELALETDFQDFLSSPELKFIVNYKNVSVVSAGGMGYFNGFIIVTESNGSRRLVLNEASGGPRDEMALVNARIELALWNKLKSTPRVLVYDY